jgi:SAM-dependent MidA family methyltransferase
METTIERMQSSEPESVATALQRHIAGEIAAAGGWLPFDRYMALALYTPGLGYYARESQKFGAMPASGSDFVTAPELSSLFGRALAAQIAQALTASGSDEVIEFGAGSGALAAALIPALDALGCPLRRYTIVELSASLRARQASLLAAQGSRVQWAERWPARMRGVVLGNEVLDAMPVQLLVRAAEGSGWLERGVVLAPGGGLAFEDRASGLSLPLDASPQSLPPPPGMVTEIHPQAEAFVRSLAEHLEHGAAFFIDYGFPEAEYYHPQRSQGTLMCHRAHRADDQPLADPGEKDITAHVNFTGIALAAEQAGLEVLGYTSQGRFLINCGIGPLLAAADLRERVMAQRLVHEHEMGELFKVIGFATTGLVFDPIGFAAGDRTHRL